VFPSGDNSKLYFLIGPISSGYLVGLAIRTHDNLATAWLALRFFPKVNAE
jgi:hypothetical protein